MPTYQYVCTACGGELEAVQSFSDPALTTCPTCEGALRKVFSAVGVVFKGSGFYKTDSRSAPAKSGDTGSTATKESGSAGAEAGAAKPASSTPASTPASSTPATSKPAAASG